jgi:hypothetical protein
MAIEPHCHGDPKSKSMSEPSFAIYKWSIWTFLAAYIFVCFQMSRDIGASESSTAAIGYFLVPFAGVIVALPFAVAGYAIGALIRARKTRRRRHVILASVSTVLSVAYLTFLLMDAIIDHQMAATIVQLETSNSAELEGFLESDTYSNNLFVLAAIAMHPDATSTTLARIAAIDDLSLHEKFGGPAELMGGNHRGYAVMRLVVLNPQVSSETLALLSRSPDTYVLGDVAGNMLTPKAVVERLNLERHNKSDGYLIEWGLANNKRTPESILRELAENSRNEYTLQNIGRNPSTPSEVKKLVERRITSGDYERN